MIYDMLSLAADMDRTLRPMAIFWIGLFVAGVCWGAGALMFLQLRLTLLLPAVVFPCACWAISHILNIQDIATFAICTTCAWVGIHSVVSIYLLQVRLWPRLLELSMRDLMLPIKLAEDRKNIEIKLDWEWPQHAFGVALVTGIVLYVAVGQVAKAFSPHTR